MKLKKGDNVQIITGKDYGKQGRVVKVYAKNNRILVQGLNLFKKHQRPKKQGEKGEVVTISKPLAVSNVMIVCGNCGKTTRLGYKMENDAKVRYCKKCRSAL